MPKPDSCRRLPANNGNSRGFLSKNKKDRVAVRYPEISQPFHSRLSALFAGNCIVPAKRTLFPSCGLLVILLAGCATNPPAKTPVASTPLAAPTITATPTRTSTPVPVAPATIKGSEESSLLLDNFTAFISAVDDKPLPGDRSSWATAITLPAGRRTLTVEFVRGVFSASTDLDLDVTPHANYEVRFNTDAQLFGHNSFCEFWVVDLATRQPVTAVRKVPVRKKS